MNTFIKYLATLPKDIVESNRSLVIELLKIKLQETSREKTTIQSLEGVRNSIIKSRKKYKSYIEDKDYIDLLKSANTNEEIYRIVCTYFGEETKSLILFKNVCLLPTKCLNLPEI